MAKYWSFFLLLFEQLLWFFFWFLELNFFNIVKFQMKVVYIKHDNRVHVELRIEFFSTVKY